MLSSATYLLNDVRDREQDRAHPRKRLRPIASGALPVRAGLALAVALAVGGLALAAAIRPAVRRRRRRVPAAHRRLLAVAAPRRRCSTSSRSPAAFVVRAVAGGAATDVPLSRWFLVVTSCGAIVRRRRQAPRRALRAPTATPRRAPPCAATPSGRCALLMASAAAGMLVAYAIWAFRRPEHGPWYEATIVPVVLWLGRYALLVARGAGEAPEELILRDPPLLVLTLLWTALFVGGDLCRSLTPRTPRARRARARPAGPLGGSERAPLGLGARGLQPRARARRQHARTR